MNEAARSAACFQGSDAGERIDEIVLNRVVEAETDCSQCRYRIVQSRAAHKFLRTHFPQAKVLAAEDPGCPILGMDALRQFGRHIFAGRKFSRSIITKPPKAVSFKLEAATWPDLVTPLTLTLGKGGVGKTTVSAGLAYHHRKSRKSDGVVVCSIDPAPSLGDVFATKLGNKLQPVLRDRQLQAVEVDAMADFQRWTSELRARLNDAMTGEQSGIHLDVSLDRKFLLALLDVVPPGVDEIFAIFRILDLLPTRRPGGDRYGADRACIGSAANSGAAAGVDAGVVENPGRTPYTTPRSGGGGRGGDAVAKCAGTGADFA